MLTPRAWRQPIFEDRVSAERRLNEARIAEDQRQYEAWLAATYEPPPF